MMRGAALKAEYARLMQLHRCRPISREPLALFEATSGPVVVEGVCSSSAIDAERMSFKADSLSWSALDTIPLLLRHAGESVGKILRLDYVDGELQVGAKVDDLLAAQMPAFSIAATVLAAETISADSPAGFHFTIHRAVIDEVSLTDKPSNPKALIVSRRDLQSADQSYDDLIASINRFRGGLEAFIATTIKASEPAPLALGPAPAHIIGRLPIAAMRPRPTQFSAMVARLPRG
ncbi:hypothetical protein ABIF68_010395 [Bradyrhizobium japonicum]|jgi:hypothetical protein|uniref:hypothetical protein n=1 Tax=Bradyrhizobium TaxID=374 RepID=UPI0004AD1E62|nr:MULTISPECIES: hypothetical protein [Bradyrhizobium]MDI2076503.1 hypothetical protein [Bradyrhizobium sp. Mp27]